MAELSPFDADAHSKFVQEPNPKWTLGSRVDETEDGRAWVSSGEQAGWVHIDPATEDRSELYKLMISGIVPRPVAFVSSESPSGVQNLAPFSWFNMVSHTPPLLSISISNAGAGAGGAKDTTANIRATRQFVVNIISEPFIHQANAASIDAPEDVSEWPLSGLTRVPSTVVKPPRVKESAFSMECELYDVIDIKHPDTGASTTALVLGLVKAIHVRKDVLDAKGRVDIAKYRPIVRLGDISYARIGDVFRIARPAWDEHVAEEVQALDSTAGKQPNL